MHILSNGPGGEKNKKYVNFIKRKRKKMAVSSQISSGGRRKNRETRQTVSNFLNRLRNLQKKK